MLFFFSSGWKGCLLRARAPGLQITTSLRQYVVISQRAPFTTYKTQSERRSLLLKLSAFLLFFFFLVHKWLLPGELLWKPGTGGGDNGQRLISGLRISCCFSPQRRSDVWVFGSPPGDRRTKMPPSTGWALARDLGAQLPGWSRPKHPRQVKTKVGLTGRRRKSFGPAPHRESQDVHLRTAHLLPV